MKIGKKLVIIISAVNIVCIGSLTVGSLMFTSSQIRKVVNDNASNITIRAANQVKFWLEKPLNEIRGVANSVAHFDQIKNEDKRQMLDVMLYGIASENPHLLAVWAICEPNALDNMDAAYANTPFSDSSGRFLSSFSHFSGEVRRSVIEGYEGQEYYLSSLRSGKDSIIEPYQNDTNGKKLLITSLTVPLKTKGKIIGVVGVDIELEEIQSLASGLKPFGVGATGVFSNRGIVVAHPDPSRLGKRMKETEADIAGKHLDDLIRSIKDGMPMDLDIFSEQDKATMILVERPFLVGNSATPWAAAVLIPEKVVMAPVLRMTAVFLILGAAILVVITLIILFVARSITAPLKSMERIFTSIGEGDFTQVIEERGNDEISSIGRSLNITLEKIRNLITTIKSQAAILFDIGGELSSNMIETATAINQITANSQTINRQTLNQSASVTETNATMEQVVENINKLSVQVDKQSASVAESSSAVEEMLANVNSVTTTLVKNISNVKNLTEASEIGRTSLLEVAADIQAIARESEGLLEVNAVMENIASQTNLLSMNAAIEAAHAGDAGRGFAVVADEIRKLAENSGKQSKTIATVLKRIKASIDKISISTGSVINKFEAIDGGIKTVAEQEENIRTAMEEQGQGSQQILGSIGQLNEITRNVKNGAREMLEGSKEVVQEGRNLSKLTVEITEGINEMATGADQINTAVIQVNEISGKNKDNIDILVREVSRFKVE